MSLEDLCTVFHSNSATFPWFYLFRAVNFRQNLQWPMTYIWTVWRVYVLSWRDPRITACESGFQCCCICPQWSCFCLVEISFLWIYRNRRIPPLRANPSGLSFLCPSLIGWVPRLVFDNTCFLFIVNALTFSYVIQSIIDVAFKNFPSWVNVHVLG